MVFAAVDDSILRRTQFAGEFQIGPGQTDPMIWVSAHARCQYDAIRGSRCAILDSPSTSPNGSETKSAELRSSSWKTSLRNEIDTAEIAGLAGEKSRVPAPGRESSRILFVRYWPAEYGIDRARLTCVTACAKHRGYPQDSANMAHPRRGRSGSGGLVVIDDVSVDGKTSPRKGKRWEGSQRYRSGRRRASYGRRAPLRPFSSFTMTDRRVLGAEDDIASDPQRIRPDVGGDIERAQSAVASENPDRRIASPDQEHHGDGAGDRQPNDAESRDERGRACGIRGAAHGAQCRAGRPDPVQLVCGHDGADRRGRAGARIGLRTGRPYRRAAGPDDEALAPQSALSFVLALSRTRDERDQIWCACRTMSEPISDPIGPSQESEGRSDVFVLSLAGERRSRRSSPPTQQGIWVPSDQGGFRAGAFKVEIDYAPDGLRTRFRGVHRGAVTLTASADRQVFWPAATSYGSRRRQHPISPVAAARYRVLTTSIHSSPNGVGRYQ